MVGLCTGRHLCAHGLHLSGPVEVRGLGDLGRNNGLDRHVARRVIGRLWHVARRDLLSTRLESVCGWDLLVRVQVVRPNGILGLLCGVDLEAVCIKEGQGKRQHS